MDRLEVIRAAYRKIYGPRDRRILALLAAGASQAEVARKVGVTRQRIHQILARERANGGPK